MVEIFVDITKFGILFIMLDEKHNIEKEAGDLTSGCRRWIKFADGVSPRFEFDDDGITKRDRERRFEPYKKLIPKRPPLYYNKHNPDWQKVSLIMSELDRKSCWKKARSPQDGRKLVAWKYRLPKGKNASDVAKNIKGVNARDVTKFIKINKIFDDKFSYLF